MGPSRSSSGLQALALERLVLGLLADEIHHRVHRQPSDQPSLVVDHRGRDQVVALEGAGGGAGLVERPEALGVRIHQIRHPFPRPVQQQRLQRQDALEPPPVVHHEQAVGLVGEGPQAPQQLQHVLDGGAGVDGDLVVVHQVADGVVGVGDRRLDPGPRLGIQRQVVLLEHVVGHVLGDLGEVVVVDVVADGEQPVAAGGPGERVGDPVGGLPQHVARLVQAHLFPRRPALVGRQHFQQVGDVGGGQGVDPVGHLRQVLAMGDPFHQFAVTRALAKRGVGDHPLAVQQRDDGLDPGPQPVVRRRRVRGRRVLPGRCSATGRGNGRRLGFGHGSCPGLFRAWNQPERPPMQAFVESPFR